MMISLSKPISFLTPKLKKGENAVFTLHQILTGFETNFSNRELKKDTLLIPQCCFSLIWLTDSIIPHAVSGSSNITPSGPGVCFIWPCLISINGKKPYFRVGFR